MNTFKRNFLLASLLGALFLSSCSRITIVHREQWESVVAKIDTIQYSLLQLDSTLYNLNESIKTSRIEQEFSTIRVEEKIEQIANNLTESQRQLSEISVKTGAIGKHIREKDVRDSLQVEAQEDERNQLFKMAEDEFIAGQFSVADTLYQEFIDTYSDDNRVSLALFKRGECSFALEEFTTAETVYKEYYTQYRDGEEICAVFYKWGSIYDQSGESARRDFVWKQLVETCPNSKEAKLIEVRTQD